MKQWLKDFVHNCVVHPMMPFLPTGLANALHEVNGSWAFGKPYFFTSIFNAFADGIHILIQTRYVFMVKQQIVL